MPRRARTALRIVPSDVHPGADTPDGDERRDCGGRTRQAPIEHARPDRTFAMPTVSELAPAPPEADADDTW